MRDIIDPVRGWWEGGVSGWPPVVDTSKSAPAGLVLRWLSVLTARFTARSLEVV